MTQTQISPATHTWRSAGYILERCLQCTKQTTGRMKPIGVRGRAGRERPLCSDCAGAKGFNNR